MSDSEFNAIVQKIAASPTKLALMGKYAGMPGEKEIYEELADVLAKNVKPDGKRQLRHMLMSGALMATATAGGMVLRDVISDVVYGKQRKEREESGKLSAQEKFKSQRVEELQPLQSSVFKKVIKDDEVLSDADPEMLKSTFSTMRRFAPSLASDPNAVRSFLRESATYGTGPNYASLKNLADAERAVAQAGGIS